MQFAYGNMEGTVVKDFMNDLLERREITLQLRYESGSTPSKDKIKEHVHQKIQWQQDLITVKYVNQIFGTRTIKAIVYLYKNPQAKERYDAIKKKVKKAVQAAGGEHAQAQGQK